MRAAVSLSISAFMAFMLVADRSATVRSVSMIVDLPSLVTPAAISSFVRFVTCVGLNTPYSSMSSR